MGGEVDHAGARVSDRIGCGHVTSEAARLEQATT